VKALKRRERERERGNPALAHLQEIFVRDLKVLHVSVCVCVRERERECGS